MTQQQLIDAIRALVLTDSNDITLGDIERAIKMPKNSLSGMLNGTRNFAKKWLPLLEAYVEAKMKGKTEIIIPIGEAKIAVSASNKQAKKKDTKLTPATKAVPPNAPPPAMSKAQQLRWHREQNQTLT